jgi:hypothetical protein
MQGRIPSELEPRRESWFSSHNRLAIAGVAMLVGLAFWWYASLQQDRLVKGHRTWVPLANWIGVDFLSNYHASRHWLAGGDPYTEPFGDPLNRPFVYSPVVLALFGWCRSVTAHQAVVIWTVALAVMAAIGAAVCWRTRRQLGLWPLPLPFLMAALLASFPIVFEMERGNCDLLVLMLIVIAAGALGKHSLPRDLAAGFCVAVAVWIKIYPALLLPGLVAARRPRALVCAAVAYLAIGLADYPDTLRHVHAMRSYIADYDIGLHPTAHPFGTYWKHLWAGTRLAALTKIPGTVGACGVLAPLVLWVTYNLFRQRSGGALLYPYFAWLAAVGTFLPPVSNDYNLFFLPVAALAAWDRRDRVIVHLLMGLLLLWWQPLQLSMSGELVFGFKLLGLGAVGTSLIARSREQAQVAALEGASPVRAIVRAAAAA